MKNIQLKYSNTYKVLGWGMSALPPSHFSHFRSPSRILSSSHSLILKDFLSFFLFLLPLSNSNIQNPMCLLLSISLLGFGAKCVFWDRNKYSWEKKGNFHSYHCVPLYQDKSLLPTSNYSSWWNLEIYKYFPTPCASGNSTLPFFSWVLKKKSKRD